MNVFNLVYFCVQFLVLVDVGVYFDSVVIVFKLLVVIDVSDQFYCLSVGNVYCSQFVVVQWLIECYEVVCDCVVVWFNVFFGKDIVWMWGIIEVINMVV